MTDTVGADGGTAGRDTDGGSAEETAARGSAGDDPGDPVADDGPADPMTDDDPDGSPAREDADASARGGGDGPRKGDDGPSVFLPSYGPVEAAVGYVLFYLIVERATPVLVDELAAPFPDLVPEPFTTYAAILLWLFLVVILLATVRGQLADNPRTFADAGEREAFLEERRRAHWRYRVDGALVVAGGAATVLTWDVFVGVLVDLLSVVVVELDGATPALPGGQEIAIFVVFFVGVAALARGLDRLLVGGVRELLYGRYRE